VREWKTKSGQGQQRRPIGVDWAASASDADYIHYVVEDLAGFLGAAAALEREAIAQEAGR